MVRAKIFAAALATCLVQGANASACKPRSSLSTESQILSTVSSVASSIATETSTIVDTSTTAETSTFAITTTSQPLRPSSTMSEASTTTTAAAPVNNVCGQHGTCSPGSSGCRSRSAGGSALYLGECQDMCRADPNCKSILYNNKEGQCFLNTNIAQDSGFYTISSTMFEWWDNACDIEKRQPDPICGAHGDCNQSKCFPMAVSGFHTAETCQQSCASDLNCESFVYFPSSEGCYTLERSLFKSGFYEQPTSDGLWFDRACQVHDPAKV
ncbi:unnamed protein product [Fusarium equiseti]|uniref:Apple domain-containing protein n=1 Tax=Fusarium equiseti TaxID=61235 RepID=A0A8J2N6J3_FUSEQ|nr:unnamed protein product [Fusarium equiseti]